MDINDPTYLTSTDAAQVRGVSSDTIRHWRRIGLITPAIVTRSGFCLYRRDDIERVTQPRPRSHRPVDEAAASNAVDEGTPPAAGAALNLCPRHQQLVSGVLTELEQADCAGIAQSFLKRITDSSREGWIDGDELRPFTEMMLHDLREIARAHNATPAMKRITCAVVLERSPLGENRPVTTIGRRKSEE